jgi:hypothetical protein
MPHEDSLHQPDLNFETLGGVSGSVSEIEKADPKVAPSEPLDPEAVVTGQWYWIREKDERWLGCVIAIGSNYIMLDGPEGGPERIHFDTFDARCERELDPDAIIDREVEAKRIHVAQLMSQVRELTARLALSPSPVLGAGEECQALAVATQGRSYNAYSKALEKAKKTDLPELFRKIEYANKEMAHWMSAKVIPLRAEAEGMKSVIEQIEDRVFNVELYAGLVEQVVLCKDGEPAPVAEKIRLLQRRHYMDEECLAQYEIGGMEFKDIEAFDRWICRKKNRDRLLPFPRCVVAFRVRRAAKWRDGWSLSDFLEMFHLEEADKKTFLYMRNGERVYRLMTQIEFGEQLFPDIRQIRPTDAVWAKVWSSGQVQDIITDGDYQQRLKAHQERERKRLEEYEAAEEDDKWRHQFSSHSDIDDYSPFNQTNVFYDDIANDLQGKLKKHNRVALVLQGILDRSPVFHPHPPWQIWTEDGFNQALELLYDDSHALVSGPPPNFEAYRARLNKSLKPGCVTVGQQDFWERHEAEKENRRQENDHRNRGRFYEHKHYKPYGNPGPGDLARPVDVTRTGKCTYHWVRERQVETYEHRRWSPIDVRFVVPSNKILCLDAYEPGDFRQFFDDPRTRAEYLKWAPFLLEGEEYKAGNRTVREPGKGEK